MNTMTQDTSITELTLYEQLGGAEKLRTLVDRFYDLMALDANFQGIRQMHPTPMDSSRDKLFWFLSGWMGGPDLFTEKFGHPRLRARHLPYSIGISERNQWLICMGTAMEELAIEEPLRDHLWQSFSQTADWMRNRAE